MAVEREQILHLVLELVPGGFLRALRWRARRRTDWRPGIGWAGLDWGWATESVWDRWHLLHVLW